MQLRYFHCPVCYQKMMIPKYKNFKREIYKGQKHRKTMWCAICKHVQNFILDDVERI